MRFNCASVAAVVLKRLPQPVTMILRHLIRYPMRAFLTSLGIASSVALLIASLFSLDSIELMIDVTYFRTMRQDITVTFNDVKSTKVREDVQGLPGVLNAEVSRLVPVTMRNGSRSKRLALAGFPPGAEMQRLLDVNMNPVALPESGVVLSEKLAGILGAGLGDRVTIDTHYGRRRQLEVPVTGITQGYLGLAAYMALDPLNEALGDGRAVSTASLMVDKAQLEPLYARLKETPAVAGLAVLQSSLRTFRETLARNLNIMTAIYAGLAGLIAFGVVYNSARIQLSERGRELASLRVLGFTRGEVSQILLGEVAVLVVLAIPAGWVMGYGLAVLIVQALDTDLYRVPLMVSQATYAEAALVAIVAAAISAFIVRRRIDQLDLVAVLKTRE